MANQRPGTGISWTQNKQRQPHRRCNANRRRRMILETLETRRVLTAVVPLESFDDVDWTSAAVGGIGQGGTASITLQEMDGPVEKAFLFWQGIDRSADGGDGVYDNATVQINGVDVTGTSLGISSTGGWGDGGSQAYHADVTDVVVSGGTYTLSGLADKPGHDANGASLIVIYDDGDEGNDHDLQILAGNLVGSSGEGETGWSVDVANVVYPGGDARVQLHVAGGRTGNDPDLLISAAGGTMVFPDAGLFDGDSTSTAGHSRASDGSLWDLHDFSVQPIFSDAGSYEIHLAQSGTGQEPLALVAMVMETVAVAKGSSSLAVSHDGTASDSHADGSFDHLNTTSTKLEASVAQHESRALLELAIPGDLPDRAVFRSVTLDSEVLKSESLSDDTQVLVRAYAGDGTVTLADLESAMQVAGQFAVPEIGLRSFALNPQAWRGVLDSGATHVGFEISLTDEGRLRIASDKNLDAQSPELSIVYQVLNRAPIMVNQFFHVDENSGAETEIGSVVARDADLDALSLAIVGGNDDGWFVIDSSGSLRVAPGANLDFETQSTYPIEVQVTDQRRDFLSTYATIDIHVNDVNEAPIVPWQELTLAENSPAGTLIGTVQATDQEGDSLTLEIVDHNEFGGFELNASTGELRVASPDRFDYEVQSQFPLRIRATDTSGLSSEETILVSLSDVNETPVVSDQEMTIDENSPGGSLVGTVLASDPDGDAVTYSITAGLHRNSFEIDPVSGEIRVRESYPTHDPAGILDHEARERIFLQVAATDSSGLRDTGNLVIHVADVNESPEIEDAQFAIDENSEVGSSLGFIDSSDPDGDSVTYAIVGGNELGVFAVDAETGELRVEDSASLDFESHPTFTLTIRGSDEGGETGEGTVVVHVQDVNERPTLVHDEFVVAENSAAGTHVGTVNAADPEGDTVRYWIIDGNASGAFAIDAATGALSVADSQPLDFEQTQQFQLRIGATDPSQLSDQYVFTIQVSDVNETPVVSDQEMTIDENSPGGSLVGTVLASDPDGDEVIYSITAGLHRNSFEIDPVSGEIRVRESYPTHDPAGILDHEARERIFLQVAATDSSGLRDTGNLVIHVADVNESPEIEDAQFAIDENTPPGTSLGFVSATDPEGDSVTYAIVGGNELGAFGILPESGELLVRDARPLDYESRQSFELQIEVTDPSGLQNVSTAIVDLRDVNEAPIIEGRQFAIDENSAGGTSLGFVVASDPEGESVNYEIVDGTGLGVFAIIGATGQLRVRNPAPLDFETNPTFTLTIRATDGSGNESDLATVVHVRDVNERPRLRHDVFVVAENSAVGTQLGSVQANDPDGDTVRYWIIDGNAAGAFEIDAATGALSVADSQPLDFEQTQQFQLRIGATDPEQLSDQRVFTITLSDVNEAPEVASQQFTINENSVAGSLAGTALASDPDGDPLTFAITGGNELGAFEITAGTGELRVRDAGPLDYESRQQIQLQISASDSSGLSNTATVIVHLHDVQESPVLPDHEFTVAENRPEGSRVGTVRGDDPDGDRLTYSIVSGNQLGAFDITAHTGEIRVQDSRPLDHETNPQFVLTVRASDPDGNSDDATVIVNLTNVNEAPEASDQQFSVVENSAVGTLVGTIEAIDPEGDDVYYGIAGGDPQGAFRLDLYSGELTVADSEQFDFESQSRYELQVLVLDRFQASTQITVVVDISDVDEAPVMEPISLAIDENSSNGDSVGFVRASDPEAENITYVIASQNPQVFVIDANTGELTVRDSRFLDHERYDTVLIGVRATDPAGNSVTRTGTVEIRDVNEAPYIPAQGFSVSEDRSSGWTLGHVAATDPDGDELHYSLVSGNSGQTFTIHPITGAVRVATAATLNYEEIDSFDLGILVRDEHGLATTTTIHVNVLDVNEAPRLLTSDLSIKENSASGAIIGWLRAEDEDHGQQLTFELSNPDIQYNSSTGELRVANSDAFDHETRSIIPLQVIVRDNGVPRKTTSGWVNLHVLDVNEAPTLTNASFLVDENVPVGTVVGTLVGEDPDDGQTLTYHLRPGFDSDAFTVDSTTGQIIVADANRFDHEADSSLTFDVEVRDNGEPALWIQKRITVDLNDLYEVWGAEIDPIPGSVLNPFYVLGGFNGPKIVVKSTQTAKGELFDLDATGLFNISNAEIRVFDPRSSTFATPDRYQFQDYDYDGDLDLVLTMSPRDLGVEGGMDADTRSLNVQIVFPEQAVVDEVFGSAAARVAIPGSRKIDDVIEVVGDNRQNLINIRKVQGNYVITTTSVSGGSSTPPETTILSAEGVQSIYAMGLDGDDTIEVDPLVSANLVLEGGDGDDTLVGANGIDVLMGGSGDDTLSGGLNDDILDGWTGNDQLWGGFGRDILLGGPQDDYLRGDEDADILIGGLGTDTLEGGDGDDLLIAGWTVFDSNHAILKKLWSEWNSPRTYEQRVLNLSGQGDGPRFNDDYFLRLGETVFLDDHDDQITGDGGRDWFFYDSERDSSDRELDEFFANEFE